MRLPMEQAYEILNKNISQVRRVADWAKTMGYTKTSTFSNAFRKHFGKRPQPEFTRVRLEFIKQLIIQSPEEKFFCIAKKAGLDNEKILYKFLKRHARKSPSQLVESLKKTG